MLHGGVDGGRGEDPEVLTAITPVMFLNDARSSDVTDLDIIESSAFNKSSVTDKKFEENCGKDFGKNI